MSSGGRQVALESPAHNLVMVAKESKHYSVAVEGLPCQDLWCLDVQARACHWLSSQIQRHCNQDDQRWVAHWILELLREEQAQLWQGVPRWVRSQEVPASGTRAVVWRLQLPHPASGSSRGLLHQTSHIGFLCVRASEVLTRFSKRGKLQHHLQQADCQARCRQGHQ